MRQRRKFDHSRYYQENKDEILLKKRRRYLNDKQYRRKIQRRTRERYRQSREGVPPADRMVITDRRGQEFYTIGKLAGEINRKIQTIRWYHRIGLFPDPLNYDTRGWRLYSKSQARTLAALFKRYDQGRLSTDELKEEIHNRWRD